MASEKCIEQKNLHVQKQYTSKYQMMLWISNEERLSPSRLSCELFRDIWLATCGKRILDKMDLRSDQTGLFLRSSSHPTSTCCKSNRGSCPEASLCLVIKMQGEGEGEVSHANQLSLPNLHTHTLLLILVKRLRSDALPNLFLTHVFSSWIGRLKIVQNKIKMLVGES